MVVTPKRKPRKSPARPGPSLDAGAAEAMVPLDKATLDELRAHWPRGRMEPDDLRRYGEALYGAKLCRVEIAKDLVQFRIDGKGGMRSGEALSHAMISRWLSPRGEIPPWVLAALPELPSIILERHRREAAAAEAVVRARLDEAQRAWIRERVPRYMTEIPTLALPAVEKVSGNAKWPVATPDDIGEAEGHGSSAYQVAAGLSDDDASPRPADPVLRSAWDEGWMQANRDHQEAFREDVERRKQASKSRR